ncbi:putative bifunctional diguanylate cyclase/phosphodiesterase [Thalassotalea castellviae]|uniref:Bifunctional diguanylate cyclase/phosphodiesterase n=1 Tax=Thalassotalea castellviae TaxID=3075612 RepID=A0ABU3A054_9GAMM|nr:bifunctional diguanylate cyclase/phosphodiesterase [Thalassotalea sp. W431]MDT0603544.1 bifunctional diguanylate cyclase/phosphodiesterase [Thalassotalea sp. W431]
MHATLLSVLNSLQQVIFEVTNCDTGEVQRIAGNSQWAFDLFPLLHQQDTIFIDDHTPFLQDFLIDAQQVWQGNRNNTLKSGFWTEVTDNQKELHLEATAIRHNDKNILLITSLAEEFKSKQNTLQSARELLLSNDRLIEQNEYLHSRLLTILKKPEQQGDILIALTKAIENAGFSVIITDSSLQTLIENSSTYSLFEQRRQALEHDEKPIDIIFNLMKSQLPEFDRIMNTKSGWDGELCWISPPSTLKWLKIALYPVKTELNEVNNWIIFTNDVTNIKHLVQKNEQLALQDMLTELPNRFSFWQKLERQTNEHKPFYLLYLDINNFRSHNEYYGHDDGDKLLIELSERITATLNNNDYLARIGGDEFAIILSDIENEHDCKKRLDKIFACTYKPFISTKGEPYSISVSVGAANYPKDANSVEELMKFVDLSAYSGKDNNNKNSIQFYSQSLQDASLHIIELEKELRDAIKYHQFELYLQPIVNLEQNSIYKAEALIRWNHPEKGLISPIQFIPEAEKSELINAIGHWVIKSACELVKQLNKHGYNIKISINLSPSQVIEENLFSFIHNCIKEYNIEPDLLEFEVTEGVLVNDYAIAEKLLSKIRAIGMSVSVDDFGTGYSSLAYLKRLPLDFVKIDQSFVKDIVVDDNDKAIVRAVIAMAHNLNLGVTAEGVETVEQLKFLKNNACNSVQGYLYSRPINFESFLKLIKEFY